MGDDCVLGASVALQADAESLQEAYDHFKTEAHNLAADYQPQTVNTDGWKATQTAWLNLFPAITVIPSASLRAGLCLLHAFLKIRDRCQRMTEHVAEIYTRVWEAYHRGDLWSCG